MNFAYSRSRPWTDAEIVSAQTMLEGGDLMKDIAEALGRSFDSVATKLKPFARTLKERRHALAISDPLPDSFTGLLKRFPQYGDAAQWMGVERRTAKSMAGRDWIPRRYWPALTKGLERQCGLEVPTQHLESLASARERWEREAPKPRDWANLPAMERSIAKIVQRKVKDRELADDAAGYAILEMMEYAQPHLGYGVRCAFNFVVEERKRAIRVECLSDEELNQAVDLRVWTPANQVHAVHLQEVFAAAKHLTAPYDDVFRCLCRGYSNAEIAARHDVSESTAAGYKAHVRNLLRAYAELDAA